MWLHGASRRGTVFLFHRVSDRPDPAYPPLAPEEFDRQCRFFLEHFDVIPLSEFVARVREGKPLARLASITFDDGYHDFLTEAYPILRNHGLPCTHFLVADSVRTGKPTWNLRLRHLVTARAERERLALELAAMTAAERTRWLDEREAAVRTAHPPMLGVEDLSRVDPRLVAWESHTSSHALLDKCPRGELERELVGSRREIAEWSGRSVRFLSYPNGMNDGNARERAKAAGYECALAVSQERVRPGADLFALPRLDVGALPRNMLASEVAGVNAALRGLF